MSLKQIAHASLLAICAGSFFGCAASHLYLEPEVANDVKSIDIVSIIEQDEVEIQVKKSTGGSGFGLLGALVDAGVTSSRKSSAEDLILKLRAQLRAQNQTFVFRDEFWAALDTIFTKAEWPSEFALERRSEDLDKDGVSQLVSDNHHDATLVLHTRYFLTPSVTILAITTHAEAYLHDPSKRIYLGDCTYLSARISADDTGIEKEVAVDTWASEGAKEFLEGVREGIAENIKMLRYDLIQRNNAPPPDARSVSVEYEDPDGIKNTVKAEGLLLGTRDGRAFLRNKKGALFSMPEQWLDAFAVENDATK